MRINKLNNLVRTLFVLLLAFGLFGTGQALASDRQARADIATAEIIFEFEADDFASYGVRRSGFLDITFASNVPSELYSEIITTLKAHPDIRGVLASKSGPSCSRF